MDGDVAQTVQRVDGGADTAEAAGGPAVHAVGLPGEAGDVERETEPVGEIARLDEGLDFLRVGDVGHDGDGERTTGERSEGRKPFPSL